MNKFWSWLWTPPQRDIFIGMLIMAFFWIFFSIKSCSKEKPIVNYSDSINLDTYRLKIAELSLKANRLIAENLFLKQKVEELQKHPIIRYTKNNTPNLKGDTLYYAWLDSSNRLYNFRSVYAIQQQEIHNYDSILNLKDNIIKESEKQIDTMLTVILRVSDEKSDYLKTIALLKESNVKQKKWKNIFAGTSIALILERIGEVVVKFVL